MEDIILCEKKRLRRLAFSSSPTLLHESLHHETEKEKKSQGATLTFGSSGFMKNSSNICYRLRHSSFNSSFCPFRVCPQLAEFFPVYMKNSCRRHWEDSTTGHEYKCSIFCESIGLFFSLLCSTLLIQIHTHTYYQCSVRMYSTIEKNAAATRLYV